ncbi:unnamed protein product, partial [Brenthis ino]
MIKVLKLDKLTQKKNKYASRLKKALKLTENSTFQKIINKSTSLAAIFFNMQFREVRKMKMGRRFTEQEKVMALSIYKQGPKCYRLLSKIFVLPSPLTLSRLIKQADLRAGINEKLFEVMTKKIKNMNTDDKLCILLFDEIAISLHFEYNQRKDVISGFITNGTTKQNKIAHHALVFMIRGILRNYKQPVAYTFCAGSTKREELAVLIKIIIKKLHNVGLRVLATVCDQGASNLRHTGTKCLSRIYLKKIANLTEIEKRFLLRIVPFVQIIRIQNWYSQDWCKGQVVLFAKDIIELAEQLPLQPQQAGLVIVTENLENLHQAREFQIEMAKLNQALKWLLVNNALYKDVRASFSNVIDLSSITQIAEAPVNIEPKSTEPTQVTTYTILGAANLDPYDSSC